MRWAVVVATAAASHPCVCDPTTAAPPTKQADHRPSFGASCVCPEAYCSTYACPPEMQMKAGVQDVHQGRTPWSVCCQDSQCGDADPQVATTRRNTRFASSRRQQGVNCNVYECPLGSKARAGVENLEQGETPLSTCCEDLMCDSFQCPDGTVPVAQAKDTKQGAENATEVCCEDLMCDSFQCPDGTVPVAQAKDTKQGAENATEVCCEDLCAAHTCSSPGKELITAANTTGQGSAPDIICCQDKFCDAFECPDGMRLVDRPQFVSQGWVPRNRCCADLRCTDFVCPPNTRQRHGAEFQRMDPLAYCCEEDTIFAEITGRLTVTLDPTLATQDDVDAAVRSVISSYVNVSAHAIIIQLSRVQLRGRRWAPVEWHADYTVRTSGNETKVRHALQALEADEAAAMLGKHFRTQGIVLTDIVGEVQLQAPKDPVFASAAVTTTTKEAAVETQEDSSTAAFVSTARLTNAIIALLLVGR